MKLAKKKQEDKMTMWQEIRDNEENKLPKEKRKTDFEEQRCLLIFTIGFELVKALLLYIIWLPILSLAKIYLLNYLRFTATYKWKKYSFGTPQLKKDRRPPTILP
jgi:hypothetical protein